MGTSSPAWKGKTWRSQQIRLDGWGASIGSKKSRNEPKGGVGSRVPPPWARLIGQRSGQMEAGGLRKTYDVR